MSKSKKNGKSDWDWFEDSPVAMTEENWSETKIIIDGLRNDGITDIRQYAQDNPTFLAGVSSTVHVVNANLAILKIYKALNKKEFLDAFSVLPDPETYNPQTGLSDIFCTLLENFANGVSSVVIEGPDTTMEGSIIHVRTTTAIAAGHEDDWGLVVQTVEDITEKKTVEDAVRENDERYKLAIKGSNDGYWDWKVDDDQFYVSPNMSTLTEIRDLGNSRTIEEVYDRIHPDDVERVRKKFLKHLDGQTEFYSCEYRVNRTGEEDIWVLSRGLALRDETCRAYRVAGSLVNTTARRQAEQKLKESQALLAQAQTMANIGSWQRDELTGKISYSSELRRIMDLSAEDEIIDLEIIRNRIHPDDIAVALELNRRIAEDGGRIEHEYRIVRSDGEIRNVASVVMAETENGKRPRIVSGTVQDVTDRKKAEEDLVAAMDSANKANRSKTDFLANMSHELRTPLNAILGFSEMIRSQALGPDATDRYIDYANDIHHSGDHLLSLINDVLDLSKIEAGKAEISETQLLPGDVIRDCVLLIGDRAREAGLVLMAEGDDLSVRLTADKRMVKQMLLNLLSNALKFTPAGGRIGIALAVDENGGLGLSVSDSGVGIKPEDIPKALSVFGQIEDATDQAERGTGLGLPIMASLAELHGGFLKLESEPGKGTTATINFPANRCDQCS